MRDPAVPPPGPTTLVPERVSGTTLNRLRCFQVVVEEAGFKRATARLHITQPALSYQIKQLEEDLGAQLFYRRPGGVSPTEAGRLLFHHAQRISAAVRQAQRAIQELSEGEAGEVRVGTVNSVGTYFLPRVLLALRERCPGTRANVLYREADGIVDTLLANQLDLAILADPRPDRRLHQELLFEERVSLVCGRGHPLFGERNVRPKRLKGAQFVALSRQTPTGALVARYLDRQGVATDAVLSTDNVETVKRMVEIGMGVALLPDMVTHSEVVSDARPGARLGRAVLDPPITRRVVLVRWKDQPESRAVSAFVDEVRRQSRLWPGTRTGQ